MTHLHDAASAVEEATRAGGIDAFDDTVTAGVSADFCAALSDLGGRRRREPFEVGFRWSPGLGSELPPRTVSFPPDAGALIRAASSRLRRLGLSIERSGRPQHLQRVVDLAPMEVARRASLDASGAAALVGRVESLHDDSGGTDRWRVRVRGELRTDRATGSRRAVWVRLDGQTAYDLAIEAHRAGQLVRAEGVLSNHTGRVELTAAPGRFAIDGTNP